MTVSIHYVEVRSKPVDRVRADCGCETADRCVESATFRVSSGLTHTTSCVIASNTCIGFPWGDMAPSDRAAALDDVDEDHRDGHNQEEVNETSQGVGTHHS